jgi:glycosyltransferase involved in cell wall biosynthesis
MKVAIVHDFLNKLGGAERVLKVFCDLFPEAKIHTLFYSENVLSVFDEKRIVASEMQNFPQFLKNKYRFFVHRFPRYMEEFNFEGYDLVISSSTAFSHGILVPENTKHICYIHSPTRYLWDYHNEYKKEQKLRGLKKIYYNILTKKLRQWDYLSSDRPDLYLANSENVQRRVEKYYRQDSKVLYPPVEVKRFKKTPEHKDYFLIVSTLTPYKKIEEAILLFNKVGKRLVIIGDGPQRKYLESIAAENIDFLGFQSDEAVKEYMENCRAFIFPGEDDFGITPVEAMACGKPVLAYGKGGALETVVASETGEFFYDYSMSEMEDALARLMHNESFYDPNKIRKQAEKFSRNNFEKSFKKLIAELTKA